MVLRLAFLGWTFIFISDFLVYQRHSCVFPSFSFLVLSVVLISSLPADFMICVLGWSTWSLSPSSHRPTQIQFRPSIAKFINFLITRKIGLRSSKWLLSLISSIWSPSIVTASRSVPSGGRRKKTQPDAGRDETAQRGDRVGRALWWSADSCGQCVFDRWEIFPYAHPTPNALRPLMPPLAPTRCVFGSVCFHNSTSVFSGSVRSFWCFPVLSGRFGVFRFYPVVLVFSGSVRSFWCFPVLSGRFGVFRFCPVVSVFFLRFGIFVVVSGFLAVFRFLHIFTSTITKLRNL